jgi:UDP-GlcNAc:undecaprenyl-phosphate GlcNAc-1-phosphate transferase
MAMHYFILFVAPLIVSMILTSVVIHLGHRSSFIDQPDCRKVHVVPVPRLGGVAIYFSMVVALLNIEWIDPRYAIGIDKRMQTVFVGASFMFALGLWDDRKSIRARIKLLCQLIAAGFVCSNGICLERLPFIELPEPMQGIVCRLISIVWIVGLTNAINLSDGLDGLAGGISAIAAGSLAVLALLTGMHEWSFVLMMLCGTMVGFLVFNFNPAKIFLGDSGSLLLGFVLACVSLRVTGKEMPATLYAPILILIIPILDTFCVMLRRFIERRSIFSPDRSHFHHKLLAAGFSVKQAAAGAYMITLLMSGLALLGHSGDIVYASALFVLGLGCVLYVLHQAHSFQVRESIDGLLKKVRLFLQIRKEVSSLDTLELHFRQAQTLDQWWKASCIAARTMGFSSMRLRVHSGWPEIQILKWVNTFTEKTSQGKISLTFPVLDQHDNVQHELTVTILPRDTYESYGRSITMFSRLIDRYGTVSSVSLENLMIRELIQSKGQPHPVEAAVSKQSNGILCK